MDKIIPETPEAIAYQLMGLILQLEGKATLKGGTLMTIFDTNKEEVLELYHSCLKAVKK